MKDNTRKVLAIMVITIVNLAMVAALVLGITENIDALVASSTTFMSTEAMAVIIFYFKP